VGDGSSSELSGAVASGMTAVLLETPFSDEFRYDAEAGWRGAVITDLDEVLQLLDST
jgi:FMN phosphatase YigB (HAD superfamily)